MTTTPSEWMPRLFASVDAKDATTFLAFLTRDASFRFANHIPAVGQAAIRSALDGFFSSIAGCSHEIVNVWAPDDHVICEGRVTYTRLDGGVLAVPFVNVFAMAGPLIDDYAIYVDASALYAVTPG